MPWFAQKRENIIANFQQIRQFKRRNGMYSNTVVLFPSLSSFPSIPLLFTFLCESPSPFLYPFSLPVPLSLFSYRLTLHFLPLPLPFFTSLSALPVTPSLSPLPLPPSFHFPFLSPPSPSPFYLCSYLLIASPLSV